MRSKTQRRITNAQLQKYPELVKGEACLITGTLPVKLRGAVFWCVRKIASPCNSSNPTYRFFIKFDIGGGGDFSKIRRGKIRVSLKSNDNNVCFTWAPTHTYYNTYCMVQSLS